MGKLTWVEQEKLRREQLWYSLCAQGGPENVPASLPNDLRLARGGQGIYRDSEAGLAEDVAVGLRHTGRVYDEDVEGDAIIYAYPSTNRSGGRDAVEIQATKNAKKHNLPLFLVGKGATAALRSVRIVYVADWDDNAGHFLLEAPDIEAAQDLLVSPKATALSEELVAEMADKVEAEGLATEATELRRALREVLVRPHQQRFRFACIKRYGAQCAVCNIQVLELLQAAHVVPKADGGSDTAENGLLLCASHHLAFDRGLWAVDPATLQIHKKVDGPSLIALGVTKAGLGHLPALPNLGALTSRWAAGTFV